MVRQKNQIHHGIIFNFLLFFHFSSAQIGTVPNSTADSTDSYPLGPKINKNTTIVMVVLVCVFVALGFLSFLTRRCSEDRGLNRTTQRARSWRTTRGLDATVIAAFPTFVYSSIKGLKFGKGSLECAICLNEFEDDETLRLIPHCSHVFHTGCIDAWLNLHSTCPVCRASLVPSSGDISFAELLISEGNRDIESGNRDNTNPAPASDSTEVNIVNPVQLGNNQNHPPRSRSAGWRLSSIFQRSYSTGHDVVALRSGQNYERFTLRLPAEVQSQLVSASLNRARSCVVLPRVQSSRQGYRSRSGGISGRGRLTSRSGRSGRWNFSLTAPFDRRNGSRRDQGVAEGEGVGERSFERLRPDGDDQV